MMQLDPIAAIITGVAALITAVGGVLYSRSKHRAESRIAAEQQGSYQYEELKSLYQINAEAIDRLRNDLEKLQQDHAALQARHEVQAVENRALAAENRTIRDALEEIAEWIHSLGIEIPEAIKRHLRSGKK